MLNDYILLVGYGLLIVGGIAFGCRLRNFIKELFSYYPCNKGCQHAKDVGMPEYSCAKRCQYTNRKVN